MRSQLKTSHVGIDGTIDALVQGVGQWLAYPELGSRPRVIGLWGMTGTGKSSLLKSLLDELGISARTYWLDAGQNNDRDWLDEPLSRASERYDGKPFVLVVDEFQHARTVINDDEGPESLPLRAF